MNLISGYVRRPLRANALLVAVRLLGPELAGVGLAGLEVLPEAVGLLDHLHHAHRGARHMRPPVQLHTGTDTP